MTSLTAKTMHGVNAITIGDKSYLLAGGDASHRVAEARDNNKCPISGRVLAMECGGGLAGRLLREKLEEPRWNQRTLWATSGP